MLKVPQVGTVYYQPLLDPRRLEILVKDLLEEKFDITFQSYGRPGQPQHGIDLFGLIPFDIDLWNDELRRLVKDHALAGKNIVIQVKSRLEGSLTYDIIKDEYDKLRDLPFEVGVFIVATSALTDASLQDSLIINRNEIPKFKEIIF